MSDQTVPFESVPMLVERAVKGIDANYPLAAKGDLRDAMVGVRNGLRDKERGHKWRDKILAALDTEAGYAEAKIYQLRAGDGIPTDREVPPRPLYHNPGVISGIYDGFTWLASVEGIRRQGDNKLELRTIVTFYTQLHDKEWSVAYALIDDIKPSVEDKAFLDVLGECRWRLIDEMKKQVAAWTIDQPLSPKEPDDEEDTTCGGCGNPTDPEVCHCGIELEKHNYESHTFVPMGCVCGYAKRGDECDSSSDGT